MHCPRSSRFFPLLFVLAAILQSAQAAPVKVLHPQGCAHGFVEVTTLKGQRIAIGDMKQRLRGTVVTSQLTLHFFDGSLDDETTVYSQRGTFRFIRDHHVQRGPSFPYPLDATVVATGLVITVDPTGKTTQAHIDMPPDVYNGLASSLLMNVGPSAPETTIAVVVAAATPRIVHLVMKNAGQVPFNLGGTPRMATDFDVHVDLGGVTGIVAPLVGKEPHDYHVLLVTGEDPAFIREDGPLFPGGPICRIQQISATFPE